MEKKWILMKCIKFQETLSNRTQTGFFPYGKKLIFKNETREFCELISTTYQNTINNFIVNRFHINSQANPKWY